MNISKPDQEDIQRLCACGCGEPSADKRQKYARYHKPSPPTRISDKSIVLLSPEDEDLRERRWTLSYDGYVYSSGPIHRVIGERIHGGPIPRGYQVDHINENKLDNRRDNLRIVHMNENRQNQTKPHSYKKSGLPRGVYPDSNGRVGWYEAATSRRINGKKKHIYLGSYPSVAEAVAAFDRYKREHTAYVPPELRSA